jgi:hypothetical protein
VAPAVGLCAGDDDTVPHEREPEVRHRPRARLAGTADRRRRIEEHRARDYRRLRALTGRAGGNGKGGETDCNDPVTHLRKKRTAL